MIRANPHMSEHILLEIEASELGQPLGEKDPVPGCACYRCIMESFGPTDDARFVTEQLVHDLSRLEPAVRHSVAGMNVEFWSAEGVQLPSAIHLAELSGLVDGARLPRTTWSNDELPIEAARAVPILEVVRRHGLELERVGDSWRGKCPFHGGDGPNFSVHPKREMFKCFTCDATGDGITLEMQLACLGFADAVRRLAK